MRIKMKRFVGILLCFVMMLGLMPGMRLTAYADVPPYENLESPTTVIKFDDKDWYLIAYDTSTVSLLAKECVGVSVFGTSNDYSGSTVEAFVNNWYETNITEASKAAVKDNKMFLLNAVWADTIDQNVRKCPSGPVPGTDQTIDSWWLSTDGNSSGCAMCVDVGNGSINAPGQNVENTLGVRPVLRLNLSSVIFDSSTNTFGVSYPLWVGGVQVTSANKDDVLGDADEGATVTFTPAVNDTPATLTLNGATIENSYTYGETSTAGIYYNGTAELCITLAEGTRNIINADSSDGIRIAQSQLTITGKGSLITAGAYWGVCTKGDIVINDGIVAAFGGTAVQSADGNITISNGTVTAIGDANGWGLYTDTSGASTNIKGGIVTASGGISAISGRVKNDITGTGWTNMAGTEGETAIEASSTGRSLDYKKVQFPETYKVTYKVVGGIWSDGSTQDKTETVIRGLKPAHVPTGMKAASGYTGGSWDKNPADTTITGETTFTYRYRYTPKQETPAVEEGDSVTVYRLYYAATREHFYTAGLHEKNTLVKKYGWIYEGIAWKSPAEPKTDKEKETIKPVYRLFNPFTTDHHYTDSLHEKYTLVQKYGWIDEGIAFYANTKGKAPVYRLWNAGLLTGAHHFTTSKYEYDVLVSRGWVGENEAFKVNEEG